MRPSSPAARRARYRRSKRWRDLRPRVQVLRFANGRPEITRAARAEARPSGLQQLILRGLARLADVQRGLGDPAAVHGDAVGALAQVGLQRRGVAGADRAGLLLDA